MRRGWLEIRLNSFYNLPEYRSFAEHIRKSPFGALPLKDKSIVKRIIEGRITPLAPAYSENQGDPVFLRAQNIEEGYLNFEDAKRLTIEAFKEEPKAILEDGDIVLTVDGALLGIAAVHRKVDNACCISNHMVRIRHGEKIDPEYLSWYLNSPAGQTQIKREITGSAIPGIRIDGIERIVVPAPSLDIQRALVAEIESARKAWQAKLSQADELLKGMDVFVLEQLGLKLPNGMSLRDGEAVEAISDTKQGIASQKALAMTNKNMFAVRFDAVQNGRVDPHFHHPTFSKLIDVIQTVSHKELGQLVKFSDEIWSPEQETAETFRYIEISGVDIPTGNIDAVETLVSEAPSRARMIVRDGDILISLTRPHRGAIAQADKSLDGCIASTGFSIIREITGKRISKDYLWSVLRNQICLQQMLQRSSGGNYPAITEPELKLIIIPVPSEKIQEAIASELNRRRAEARRLRESAEREWQEAKMKFEKALLE